ncbi:MAG: DNA helicase RecG, partial [Ignavibacteria bacterium]|nr:DNA helicase RecG [Ignavibacteria bacterium]
RLEIMSKSNDGFKIAETDMEIRGPGEFFGVKQSGEISFKFADLIKDRDLLFKARNIAFKIVARDPHLRDPDNINIRNYFFNNYKNSLHLIKIA